MESWIFSVKFKGVTRIVMLFKISWLNEVISEVNVEEEENRVYAWPHFLFYFKERF